MRGEQLSFANCMLDYNLYASVQFVYTCTLFLTCLDKLYAGAHKDVVRGVRWLVQPRMLFLSIMRGQQLSFANCTQVRTRMW